MDYKISRIPKGRGAFREIYIVSEESKKKLRVALPYLEERLSLLDKTKSNYAFQKGRNCALNALRHIGYRYSLSLDLENFFDSVTEQHVDGLIDQEIIGLCFIDGAPKQGLPTSPIIATIAFLNCDSIIKRALKKLEINAVYTRYADDLIFSFDNKSDAVKIKIIVKQIVEKNGFILNERKQTLQDSRNGRVVVTGIGVDDSGIHATRRTRKRMRAALHQRNLREFEGLQEWARCKLPNDLVS